MSLTQILKENIIISEKQLQHFELFTDMLLETNKFLNLTSITDEEEVAVKHYLDSLSVFDAIDIEQNAKIIDVGTGAGFPSVPMLIFRGDLQMTMLDSLNKRLDFIRSSLDKLGLDANLIHGRAEDFGRNADYREQYDFAVSRAVAGLNVLCEYCLPFVKVGGYFLAMKGPDAENEIATAQNALNELGAVVESIKHIKLIGDIERNIVVIKKICSTSDKYPRTIKKISKSPL
ncbi:MAG: 16S rRNA (guanine(527)-N(7))-methyltransferase RsmG [Clostridia bacterium]|nr:16S rRNA (guanine(527)-N(7))-methyltransferase RsmG [Clostridia bacterium]